MAREHWMYNILEEWYLNQPVQLSPLIPNFFLKISRRHCKLTQVLWACLANPIKNNSINLLNTFMFISIRNINLSQFFLEILQRYYILVIWSTIAIPGHAHQN